MEIHKFTPAYTAIQTVAAPIFSCCFRTHPSSERGPGGNTSTKVPKDADDDHTGAEPISPGLETKAGGIQSTGLSHGINVAQHQSNKTNKQKG